MIVLLALAAYAPTLSMGFLWDDHVMIENNPHLTSWSLHELRHDFTTDVFEGHGDPYYRPAQTILNRIDFTLWKLRPFGYHLTNFLGHAANSLMTVELGVLLGLTPMGAFLAGTLVSVHPIVVEQLMIIAGRAEIFGLLMTLLTLYFMLRPGRRNAVLGVGSFVIALFFKESAVMIPALIALCLWMKKSPRSAYVRILPCLILTLPYFWLRNNAVGQVLFAHDPLLIARFFIIAFPHILWTYARLIVVPWNLHSHHMVPRLSHIWGLYLLSVPALAALIFYTRSRWGLFALLWFVLCLVPKTPVMIFGNFMLEHWAYPALVGVAFLAGHLLAQAWKTPNKLASRIAIPAYLALLVFWALMVRLNVELRGTDEKMYRWALHFTTSNPIRYNLGVELLRTHRPAEAATYFEEVRASYPDDLANLHAMAIAYWESGYRKTGYYLMLHLCQTHPDYEPAQQSLRRMQAQKLD